MFKTFVGPVEESSNVAYLRPETAQGIFAQFGNVLSTVRNKVPFGIAQIGKAFRNEINPRTTPSVRANLNRWSSNILSNLEPMLKCTNTG